MNEIETRNAVIDSADLWCEDHGLMIPFIGLDYGGLHQGLDVVIDTWHKGAERRVGTAAGLDFVMRLMTVVGVERFTELRGKSCRVRASQKKVHAIGHFIKDRWLDVSEHFSTWERGEPPPKFKP